MKDKISFGIIIFVAFVLGGLSMYYFNNNDTDTVMVDGNSSCKACNSTVIVEEGSLSAAVEKVYDSVVMIRTYKGSKVASTGSGFIYKIDNKYAYIMTNHHVISGGDKCTIIDSKDKEVQGSIMGSDEYLDLAVIRIDKGSIDSAVTIGKTNEIKLGDIVFTVGSPVGYEYRGTVTNGIISGLNRLVEVSVNSKSDDWVMEVIQTNAAVNPGNSGGPLVNAKGEVIGIISLKLVENSIEGMGFAIPIDYAMSHINTLESNKEIERPLLGISMMNVTDTWSLYNNYRITLDEEITSGVVVISIENNTGASKSDLKKGDVITMINDSEVTNSAYLKYLLYKYEVGDTVKITYYRDGKFRTTNITLTKK